MSGYHSKGCDQNCHANHALKLFVSKFIIANIFFGTPCTVYKYDGKKFLLQIQNEKLNQIKYEWFVTKNIYLTSCHNNAKI